MQELIHQPRRHYASSQQPLQLRAPSLDHHRLWHLLIQRWSTRCKSPGTDLAYVSYQCHSSILNNFTTTSWLASYSSPNFTTQKSLPVVDRDPSLDRNAHPTVYNDPIWSLIEPSPRSFISTELLLLRWKRCMSYDAGHYVNYNHDICPYQIYTINVTLNIQ